MPKLIFSRTNEEFDLPELSPLQEICEEAGVPFACTEGVSGTCVIEIKEGQENLTPPTEEEEDFLGTGVLDERLACQCKIKCGTVRITF